MHNTFKGIYIKAAATTSTDEVSAEITNILYTNITMDKPEQVPIWIGPAQEGDSEGACSIAWPYLDRAVCPGPMESVRWTNITLKGEERWKRSDTHAEEKARMKIHTLTAL